MVYLPFIYGSLSLIFSLLLIPIFKKIAVNAGIVDMPDGIVKLHTTPTPYLGGVAIFLVIACMLILLRSKYDFSLLNGCGLGLAILTLVGFIDDAFVITPLQKSAGQGLAASLFIYSGYYLRSPYLSPVVAQAFSFLWFIFVSNALNLVDIMDGLAALITLLALIFFGVLAYTMQEPSMVILISIVIGAVLGFIYYNKPRATIYLGDSGSLFLGGFLGLLPFLLSVQHQSNGYIFFISAVVLGVPLGEASLLIIIRTYKKIPFYQASPHHFKSYLVEKKWNEWQILAIVFCISTLLGLVAHGSFFQWFSPCATISQLALLLFSVVFIIYK